MILDAVAVLYIQLQNYEKALAYNTQAKTLYEKALDFGDDYVRCVSNCALCHNGLGHNPTAKMMLNVALRQAKQNLSDSTAISSTLTELTLPQHQVSCGRLSHPVDYVILIIELLMRMSFLNLLRSRYRL